MFLPLPKVIPDVGPGGGAFDVYARLKNQKNAFNQQELENKKKELENKYYGPLSEAEVKSKTAYANYQPAQIMSTFLSNPAAWASLSRDQMQQLSNQMMNSLQAANQSSAQSPMGSLPQSPGQNSFSGQMAIPTTPQNINALKAALPKNVTNGSLPIGGDNPYTQAQATAAGLKTGAEVQAKQNIKQWADLQNKSTEAAEGSQNVLNYLDKFSSSYDKLSPYEKGPVAGKLPAVSSSAQEADLAAKNLVTSAASLLQTGHITNKDFDMVEKAKPGRFMNPDAKQHLVDFMKGANLRVQERLEFNNAASNLGMTVPQANSLWLKYISQKPFYSSKENRLLEDNLGTWQEYLTPEKVARAKNPESYPSEKKQSSEENKGKYSQSDLEHTAKKYNMTIDQVKKLLGDSNG